MGIIHKSQVFRVRIGSNMLSSLSNVVEIKISKFKVVNRGVLEQKVQQRIVHSLHQNEQEVCQKEMP
jgi:hypothetical protein